MERTKSTTGDAGVGSSSVRRNTATKKTLNTAKSPAAKSSAPKRNKNGVLSFAEQQKRAPLFTSQHVRELRALLTHSGSTYSTIAEVVGTAAAEDSPLPGSLNVSERVQSGHLHAKDSAIVRVELRAIETNVLHPLKAMVSGDTPPHGVHQANVEQTVVALINWMGMNIDNTQVVEDALMIIASAQHVIHQLNAYKNALQRDSDLPSDEVLEVPNVFGGTALLRRQTKILVSQQSRATASDTVIENQPLLRESLQIYSGQAEQYIDVLRQRGITHRMQPMVSYLSECYANGHVHQKLAACLRAREYIEHCAVLQQANQTIRNDRKFSKPETMMRAKSHAGHAFELNIKTSVELLN